MLFSDIFQELPLSTLSSTILFKICSSFVKCKRSRKWAFVGPAEVVNTLASGGLSRLRGSIETFRDCLKLYESQIWTC